MFYVYRKINWFFKSNKWSFIIVFISLFVANLFSVFVPKLVGNAIDFIEKGKMTDRVLPTMIVILLVVSSGQYISNYIWSYFLFEKKINLEGQLREKVFFKLLRLSTPFYEKNKTGDLMAKITNDIDSIGEAAGYGLLSLLDSSFYLVTILFVMMYTISFPLTILTIVPFPFLIYATKQYGRQIDEKYEDAQKSFGDLNDSILEDISGIRLIRAYRMTDEIKKHFFEKTSEVYHKNVEVNKLITLFMPFIRGVMSISYVIALCYGGYLISQDAITLGDLVAFYVYLNMLIWPMIAIGDFINVSARANASMKRVQETLEEQQEVELFHQAERLDTIKTIEFKNLTFQYPSSEQNNLENISFLLNKGQTIGITGKIGSGKTTVLKCLLGQYPNLEESIYMNGKTQSSFQKESFLSKIGYVSQDVMLFSKTIRENITFSDKIVDDKLLKEAVWVSDIEKDIISFEQDLDTVVGEKGIALSGGQRQRISIARAIFRKPELLILDDALSAVDVKTESRILLRLKQIKSIKTKMIVSHRISTIKEADYILVLDKGAISEFGTHEELIRKNGWYAQQYHHQNEKNSILDLE